MAYCSECGAYLPEGQNLCLSCGAKNGEPAAAPAGAAAAAYAPSDEDMKQALEEKLRREQEENRRLAEQLAAGKENAGGNKTSDRVPEAKKEDANERKMNAWIRGVKK